jgi:hypothetical protein
MIIKAPPCYDISHWKEVPDFKLVDPKPLVFITKATEGLSLVDDKFVRFASGMMEIGCIRGFFHFNRKAYDGKKQAEHFLTTLAKIDILPTDLLILDIEEGGERASQLWAWHDTVARAYPNIRVNYSRKNILDPIPMIMAALGMQPNHVLNEIPMTMAEREYFRKIWTWTAGYPYFPDLFASVPSGYIPDQTKWGPVGLWQYSAHGAVTGIIGDVDLNWISPAFQAQIGTFDLGEKTMATYTGRCTTTAKVWRTIGGERVYPDVTIGNPIRADAKQGEYLHLTAPVSGWSKAIWFQYLEVVIPPPVEPPPAGIVIESVTVNYTEGGVRKTWTGTA